MSVSSKRFTDFEWYENRQVGLMRAIEDLVQQYRTETFDRRKTVLALLARLNAFGASQFNLFSSGFRDELDPDGDLRIKSLEESSAFPPPVVLNAIQNQIGFDLEVIQRAANNRRLATPERLQTLQIADRLAWQVLQTGLSVPGLVQGADAENSWTVLTYFQKATSIRVIPYANIILIGIPYSCMQEPRDFLSIPHEIGHVIYWRRVRGDDDSLQYEYMRAQDGIEAKYLHWQEEIFADVFGCLTAGGVIAFDFQELCYQLTDRRFFENDEDHPMPILRPLIYLKVLASSDEAEISKALAQRWQRRVAQFDANWGESYKQLTGSDLNDLVDAAIHNGVEINSQRPVDKIVDRAFEILRGDQTQKYAASREVWNSPRETMLDVLSKGESFEAQPDADRVDRANRPPTPDQWFRDNLFEIVGKLQPPPELSDSHLTALWEKWLDDHKFLDPLPDQSENLVTDQVLEIESWKQIWAAAGWSTEGPPHEPGQ